MDVSIFLILDIPVLDISIFSILGVLIFSILDIPIFQISDVHILPLLDVPIIPILDGSMLPILDLHAKLPMNIQTVKHCDQVAKPLQGFGDAAAKVHGGWGRSPIPRSGWVEGAGRNYVYQLSLSRFSRSLSWRSASDCSRLRFCFVIMPH